MGCLAHSEVSQAVLCCLKTLWSARKPKLAASRQFELPICPTKLGGTSSACAPARSWNDLMVARETKEGDSSFGGTMLLPPDTEQMYLNFGGGNDFKQKLDERVADNLTFDWNSVPSSQLPSNVGTHHSMSQRWNNSNSNRSNIGARMIVQTSSSAQQLCHRIL
uniref:Uncharacterized protein n=1 Tax=Oryza brachyantha TaxID=4533 RepID=J3MX59_ORYBR